MPKRSLFVLSLVIGTLLMSGRSTLRAASGDIVLYAGDVTNVRGNWWLSGSPSGAGGQKMVSTDYGWSSPDSASSSPNDYFEANFNASAGTTYHVWLRLRAQ